MEKSVKMTKRTVLETLIAAIDAGDLFLETYDATSEDIRAYAVNEIALLDKRADKAKERAAKTKAEGDELMEVVFSVLTNEFQTVGDITSQIQGEGVSASKVVARLKKLYDAGRIEKGEVKVKPAEGGKASTYVAYKLA